LVKSPRRDKHPKKALSSSAQACLPGADEILTFIAQSQSKVGKREIARAFNLSGEDKIALKHLLREMEADGRIDRGRKHVTKRGTLPPMLVADILRRDNDGELLAEPSEWTSDDPKPVILIVLPSRDKPGVRPPGVGDQALIRVSRNDGDGPAYIGRVVKVLPKGKSQTLGIFRATPNGGGRLVPVDKKSRGGELVIAAGDTSGAEDGDLVAVTMGRQGPYGLAQAKVRERLGNMKSERAASLIAIHAHEIPHIFPPAVLRESEEAEAITAKGREDWRELALITIDPMDAKDHDDAVHAAHDDNPANPGGFILTVAIADVAAYVRPATALDGEAIKRGNSVYFPDRVVPMLPERISNDLCSLKPGVDRPALAVRIIIDAHGQKRSHTFHRILMRSAAKLAYEQAQAAISGFADDIARPVLEAVLKPLWEAYAALGRARDDRAPLYLDLPERKIMLRQDGMVDRVIVPDRLDAHKLIEEFMILANVCAAETLEQAGSPLLYRVHDEPSAEKMRTLGEVLASVGLKLPKGGALRASLFNGILRAVEGGEHQAFVNEVVLRSQAQASYTSENLGHFGLNLRRYAHFTSPIRRYADLIVHRALIAALKLGEDGLPQGTTVASLRDIGERISICERRAMAAERDTIDRLIAHHLADSIGTIFEGRIAGVTRAGMFVKLAESGADGFIPAATIGGDYYAHDESAHALVGSRTGETYRLGDRVQVKLVEAAPVAGALRFEIISDGSKGRPSGRKPLSGAPKVFRGAPKTWRPGPRPSPKKGSRYPGASGPKGKS
jgi:ribonuclease R